VLFPGSWVRYLDSVFAAEPAQILSSLLLLELDSYYVNAVQLHVNAADALVRRGVDGEGSRSADMAPVGAWHKPPAIRAEPVNLSAPGRLRTLDHACKSGQAVRRQLDLSYILGMVMVRSASLAPTGGRVCDGDRLCRVGMRVSWLRPWRAGLRE
jgi:hypothetical protein